MFFILSLFLGMAVRLVNFGIDLRGGLWYKLLSSYYDFLLFFYLPRLPSVY